MQSAVQHSVLIISPMADAPRVADSLAGTLGCSVNVAPTHRAGLIALRHRDYSVVVVDDCLAEANPAAAELLWQSFGMAVPVQINFAFSGGRGLRARYKRRSGDGSSSRSWLCARPPAAGKRFEIYPDRAPAAVPARARRTRIPSKTCRQIRVGGRTRRQPAPTTRAGPEA